MLQIVRKSENSLAPVFKKRHHFVIGLTDKRLNDVIKAVNSKDFEKQTEIITAELYGSGSKDWNADAFIKIFEKADAKRTSATEDDKPLPKLYKN